MALDTAIAWARGGALFFINILLRMTSKGTSRPELVLIVRTDAIGDFVLWLDAARALTEHYKACGKSTVLIANSTWAAWAKELALFDEVIALNVQRFLRQPRYRYHIGRRIRMLGSMTAVNPIYSRIWLLDDSVIGVCGAKERIGSVGDDSNLRAWQVRISNSWYTRLVTADPSPCMELERNAEFMRNLGQVDFRGTWPNLRTLIGPRVDSAFTAEIAAGQPYYVLFPGASRPGKQWPVSNFVQIAESLYKQTRWQGVVCGGTPDAELADDLCKRSKAPLLNWAGRTDLPQLAAILSAARFLVTNDTSAAHIGPACGVPTVCVLGGGQYGRFIPYKVEGQVDQPLLRSVIHSMPCFGCNWRCIYECSPSDPVPCIGRIQVKEVWQAIGEMLGFPP